MMVMVIGASGLVGGRLMAEFSKSNAVETVGTFLSKAGQGLRRLDITNKDETRSLVLGIMPDVVVHAAALTNVDYCETHRTEAFRINVEGTRNIADAAREAGSRAVFMSTDYVFNGKRGPYGEEDTPDPVNYYGKTKLEGERIISTVDHVIVRTTVVYGYEAHSKNFLMHVLGKLGEGGEVKVARDQYGSPTLADNLAQAIAELVKRKKSGVYNIVGRDTINRHEFALKIAERFGLDQNLIKPAETSSLHQKAPRPKKAGLRTEKAERELKTRLLGVDEGLAIARRQMRK